MFINFNQRLVEWRGSLNALSRDSRRLQTSAAPLKRVMELNGTYDKIVTQPIYICNNHKC